MSHRHKFERVKLILRVEDQDHFLLQCKCGDLKLDKNSNVDVETYEEAHPHKVINITKFGEADSLVIRTRELKVYRCRCGFEGDAHQMGIHLGNVHGLNLRHAINVDHVKETGETVTKEYRG